MILSINRTAFPLTRVPSRVITPESLDFYPYFQLKNEEGKQLQNLILMHATPFILIFPCIQVLRKRALKRVGWSPSQLLLELPKKNCNNPSRHFLIEDPARSNLRSFAGAESKNFVTVINGMWTLRTNCWSVETWRLRDSYRCLIAVWLDFCLYWMIWNRILCLV